MNNVFKTALLLTFLTLILLIFGQMIGGRSGVMFAFFLAAVMNLSAYWFSDKIVLAAYRAKPLEEDHAPELFAMVRDLAEQAQVPMPRLYYVRSATPNAFATGRDPEHAVIVVTDGIVKLLSAEEIRGVLAHELSHVIHRDTLIASVAATLAGAIGMIASMLRWIFIFGGTSRDREDSNPFFLLIMSIIMPIAAVVVQMAVSRSREFAADERAAHLCGNPLYLASALAKLDSEAGRIPLRQAEPSTAHLFIVNPLRKGVISRLFSTHPPTTERIRRLESMTEGNL